ncbi:MAG: TOPRIM nucleotidyl transferase/hydrolase domain-containing protein, partial [Planctomycetota bacterium]
SQSHIILFEEPELFLHPQAQEQFFDDLLTVSETDQVLIATHSSHLVRIDHVDSLVVLRRETQTSPTRHFRAGDVLVRSRDDRQTLKDIALVSSEVAKMFFAEKIILVEGQADYIYIVGSAEMKHLVDRRVAVVPAGSKETLPRLQEILNGFQIPYVVAYDVDPGNEQSAQTTAKIVNLVREAQSFGVHAEVSEFSPTLAEVCGNTNETSKDKPYQAFHWIKSNNPSEEFLARIEEFYDLSA